jgi:hypothetical protein
MTSGDFRRIALAIEGAEERSHMQHPDFRVHGKIFATLNHPDAKWGMIKLNPAQQREYILAEPEVYVPVSGAWGLKGCTNVRLAKAEKESVREAMLAASANLAKKPRAR